MNIAVLRSCNELHHLKNFAEDLKPTYIPSDGFCVITFLTGYKYISVGMKLHFKVSFLILILLKNMFDTICLGKAKNV